MQRPRRELPVGIFLEEVTVHWLEHRAPYSSASWEDFTAVKMAVSLARISNR